VIFLIFVATFVALACVVLPVLTLVLFCMTGRAELGVRPVPRDVRGDPPTPPTSAAAPPAATRAGSSSRVPDASRLPDGQTVVT